MRVDLLHNKIVADNMTEAFEESVREVLCPLVSEECGDVDAIVFYEDHIADGLSYEGRWYYPLTVVRDDEPEILWISWAIEPKRSFGATPYSYLGEGQIDFTIPEDVPAELTERVVGRPKYSPARTVKLKIHTVSEDKTFLAGKYSQSFVDEMARQLTDEISRNLLVEGLADSTVELQLVFAPGTYMEHTSENLTYRRLLMTAEGCRPRDFWVKWTRLDGALSYTVSDHVSSEDISFEIGEDVPQKIREKEYRFLCSSNPDKYQSAMGKKTATEWRELIKRALIRGEITKITVDEEPLAEEEYDEVAARLAAVVGEVKSADIPAVEEEEEDPIVALARAALAGSSTAAEETSEEPISIFDAISDDGEEIEEAVPEEEEATEFAPIEEPEEIEVPEETEEVEEEAVGVYNRAEAITDAVPRFFESETEESYPEQMVIDNDGTAVEAEEPEDELVAAAEAEPAVTSVPVTDRAALEEQIRREVEARVRLEYEAEARARAEREAERLRRESEALRQENERLAEAARLAEEERARQESERLAEAERSRAEEARLRAELEAQKRQEVRERDRLAEAARAAVEEQRRIEAERAAKLAREREEAERAEAERLAREEEERIAEQRRLEAERIRREAEERRAAPKTEPVASPEISYISKRAKLLFRKPVDLNVIKSIKEIVEQTLIAHHKENVQIHMKAYPLDATTIALDIIRMPESESELLVSIIKAIGNGGLGIGKITLE